MERRQRKTTPQLAPQMQIHVANYAATDGAIRSLVQAAVDRVFFSRPVAVTKTEFFDVYSSSPALSAAAVPPRIMVVELVADVSLMRRVLAAVQAQPQVRQRTVLVYEHRVDYLPAELAQIQSWCFQFTNALRVDQQSKQAAVNQIVLQLYMDIDSFARPAPKGPESEPAPPRNSTASRGGPTSIATAEDLKRVVDNLAGATRDIDLPGIAEAAHLLAGFVSRLSAQPVDAARNVRRTWRHQLCDAIMAVNGIAAVVQALFLSTKQATRALERGPCQSADTRARHDLLAVLVELCMGRTRHTRALVACNVYGLLVATIDYEASRLFRAIGEDTASADDTLGSSTTAVFTLVAKIVRESESSRVELIRCGLVKACRRLAAAASTATAEQYGVTIILHALTMGVRHHRGFPRRSLPWDLGGGTVYATALLLLDSSGDDGEELATPCVVLLLEIFIFTFLTYGIDATVETRAPDELIPQLATLPAATRRDVIVSMLTMRLYALLCQHSPAVPILLWQRPHYRVLVTIEHMLPSKKCHRSALAVLQALLQTASGSQLEQLAGIPAALVMRLANRHTRRLLEVLSCMELMGRQACGAVFSNDRPWRCAGLLCQLFPFPNIIMDALMAILVEASGQEPFGFPPLFCWPDNLQATSLLRDTLRLIGHLICLADLHPEEFRTPIGNSVSEEEENDDARPPATYRPENFFVEQLQKWNASSIISELACVMGNAYNMTDIMTRLQAYRARIVISS